MGSRDRDTKSLQDKLKVFFKKGKYDSVSAVADRETTKWRVRVAGAAPARGELSLTAELERDLSSDTPLPRRLRAAKELAERVPHFRMQDVSRNSQLTWTHPQPF